MTYIRSLSLFLAVLLSAALLLSCTPAPDPAGQDVSAGESADSGGSPASASSSSDADPAPAAELPLESDTARFTDSTEIFKMRTSLEKADEEDLSVSLSWNGVELPKAGRLYYLPVEDGFDVSGLTGLSAGKDAAGDGILYLDSHLAAIGLSPLLAHNTTTEVYYVTETQYVFLELCFTTLPVMAADIKRSSLSASEKPCSFSLWEMKNGVLRRTDSPAVMNIRGASSASMPKTGLKMELRDENGEPRKLSLLGMRKDDDWIFYASYSDNTHVRDAVGWHLWEKMTASGGFDPAGSLSVRWVELILGGKYDGFYLFMERMDEKTLSLDAERGDSLFKCVSWDVPESASLSRLKAGIPSHSSLEKKYPDPGYGADDTGWKDIAEFVRVCYETDGSEFTALAEQVMDRDQILEYWLFLNLSMAADNTWKNTYYAKINGKWQAFPWDLDITFGLGWNGDMANNFLYEQAGMDTRTYDLQAGRRLLKYVKGCAEQIRDRYYALKEAGICSADALIADAEEEWDLLHRSGAWQRNLERWPSVSSTDSLDYFKKTVRTREKWFEDYLDSLQ